MKFSRVLSHREFFIPWIGQLVSGFGDAAWLVVFALLLSAHGAGAVGLGLGLFSAGTLISLSSAGLMLDRLSDRTIVLACDVLRIVASAIALVGISSSLVGWLYGAGLIYGVGQGLYRPSYTALIMEIAPSDGLREANRLRSLGNRVAAFIGAAAGGLLFARVGASMSVMVNMATYLASIGTLLSVQVPRRATSSEEETSMLQEATIGLRTVLANPWQGAWVAQGMIQVGVVSSMATVACTLLLRGQGGAYGYVVGATAAGAFLGSLTAPEISNLKRGPACLALAMAQGIELVTLFFGLHWAVIALAGLVAGYAMSCFSLYWMTALQENTDRAVVGRVLAVDALGTELLSPLGLAASGGAVAVFGTKVCLAAACVILVASLVPVVSLRGALSLGYTEG